MTPLKEKQKLAGLRSAQILRDKRQKKIEEYNKSPKFCLECNNPIDFEKKRNKLCSQACSASYSNKKRNLKGWKLSPDSLEKLKISGKTYGGLARPKLERYTKICEKCNTTFLVLPSSKNRKYCSRKCTVADASKIAKLAGCGGYREGSGHSKSGYYKGIYCGSTYELCWVIWALDNGIKFTRFKGMLEGNDVRYIPDFILDDKKTIIELKGYERDESVNKKTHLAESLGYIVNVLRKQELSHIFDYVKNTYHTSKFETLYD
jgi:hypothetical protein